MLLSCYGEEYANYMSTTIIGIPFVSTRATRATVKKKVVKASSSNEVSARAAIAPTPAENKVDDAQAKKD